MGFSKKHQADGISVTSLKSVSTKKANSGDDECLNSGSTTPTTKGSKLPEKTSCPPAPRKLRPVSNCRKIEVVEFFPSPELDSFFESFASAERAKCRS